MKLCVLGFCSNSQNCVQKAVVIMHQVAINIFVYYKNVCSAMVTSGSIL